MEKVFDELSAFLRAQSYDWRSQMSAFVLKLATRALSGLAIGVGIGLGMALVR